MHLDEEVELYALGDLDESERRKVERHAAACPACARRLAESCEMVFELAGLLPDAGEPPHDISFMAALRSPARHLRGVWASVAGVAAAAAVVLAVITGLLLARLDAQRAQIAALHAPQVALASSHFAHVPLQPAVQGATIPNGKVVYALDRSWSYILVDAPGPYRLWVRRAGIWQDAGELRGSPAYALVRGPIEAVAVGRPRSTPREALMRARLPSVAPPTSSRSH